MNLYSVPRKVSRLPLLYTFLSAAAVAALCYYLYEWSGNLSYISYFFPVSESIWEMSKLCFYPLLIVWLFSWVIWLRKEFAFSAVIQAAGVSTAFCFFFTIAGFYILKYGLSIFGFFVNMAVLFTGMLFAQVLGFYILHNTGKYTYWPYVYMFAMIAMFTLFTVYPPSLPMFSPQI